MFIFWRGPAYLSFELTGVLYGWLLEFRRRWYVNISGISSPLQTSHWLRSHFLLHFHILDIQNPISLTLWKNNIFVNSHKKAYSIFGSCWRVLGLHSASCEEAPTRSQGSFTIVPDIWHGHVLDTCRTHRYLIPALYSIFWTWTREGHTENEDMLETDRQTCRLIFYLKDFSGDWF